MNLTVATPTGASNTAGPSSKTTDLAEPGHPDDAPGASSGEEDDDVHPPSPRSDTMHFRSPSPADHLEGPPPSNPSLDPPALPMPSAAITPPQPPLSKPTLESLDIGKELRVELSALEPEARDREVASLAALQPLDRERESIFARNRSIMQSLGIPKARKANMATKKTGQMTRSAVARRRKQRDDDDSEDEDTDIDQLGDSENESDRYNDGNGEASVRRSNEDVEDAEVDELDASSSDEEPLTYSQLRAHVGGTGDPQTRDLYALPLAEIPAPPAVKKDGWPSWVKEAYQFLTSQKLEGHFQSAVTWWAATERRYSFETSVSDIYMFIYSYSHYLSM